MLLQGTQEIPWRDHDICPLLVVLVYLLVDPNLAVLQAAHHVSKRSGRIPDDTILAPENNIYSAGSMSFYTGSQCRLMKFTLQRRNYSAGGEELKRPALLTLQRGGRYTCELCLGKAAPICFPLLLSVRQAPRSSLFGQSVLQSQETGLSYFAE